MGSKATHQMPVLHDTEDADLIYVVREDPPGSFNDYKIPRSALPSSQLQVAVTLTSAEILALFDQEQILIPAPAADKIIVVQLVTMKAIGGTTAYTGTVRIGGDTINSGAFIMQVTMPDDLNPYQVFYPFNTGGGGVVQGVRPGEAIRILGSGANPTGGDCDIVVRVLYTIIDG